MEPIRWLCISNMAEEMWSAAAALARPELPSRLEAVLPCGVSIGDSAEEGLGEGRGDGEREGRRVRR